MNKTNVIRLLEAAKIPYELLEYPVDESDLSGDMVVLQIEPSGDTECPIEAGPKEQGTVKCRMADPSTCTVIASGREYARVVVPLFEFGRTVQVALPRRR